METHVNGSHVDEAFDLSTQIPNLATRYISIHV